MKKPFSFSSNYDHFKFEALLNFDVRVQVVPSIAIAFVTYEQVKEILGVEIKISD